MPKNTERKCIVCGKVYSFCPSCKNSMSNEGWRFLYHDVNCRDMQDVLFAYRAKEITKEQAKERLSIYEPNISDALKNDSNTAREIQEIFSIKVVQEDVETKEDNDVEEIKNDENHTEDIDVEQEETSDDVSDKKPTQSKQSKKSNKK